ncbi:hypothetical protein IPL68_02005 [Candidatus Saccharibacteria bacterium]|nr:MAG: hypothetical protein IPL68_02005 [Candidatus Saccharibacteria bacterium]
MSISARRLQRAYQSQLYVGWDIASNGIDWSKVEWSTGLDSLALLGTSTLVTAGNKSQWEQFSTPGASRVVYQSRFGNSSPSCFIKYFDYGSGINTALNSYKNNGAGSRWPVLCHKVWNLA